VIDLEENLLTKFLKLMSKNITDSDLELIQLGKTLGLNLVSFANLRQSQEDDYVDRIRNSALNKMEETKVNHLFDNELFYAGSIDFMVSDTEEGKKFFLLETNGGSHRGLSILSEKQQAILYHGYYQAIKIAIKNSSIHNEKVLIIVGVPINDSLIHEKVILIEYLRKRLKGEGFSLKIFNMDNYDKDHKAKLIFLVADYKQLSGKLTYKSHWVKFNGENVSVLIGDGIARRINDSNFQSELNNKSKINALKTIIVNPIFHITDDKSLTYLASYYCQDVLKKYNLKFLMFTKAYTEQELINKLVYLIRKEDKSYIIKPKGGSGGAGVLTVSKIDDLSSIKQIINKSKEEFFEKFSSERNPFPYTIQEKADFCLIDWRNEKHTFDLRLYLTQKDNIIIPVGGLARISRDAYKQGKDKQEYVVNLSGYDGKIEVDRGVGFSKENSTVLNLTDKEFVDFFCIGCIIFKSIVKHFEKISNFSNWDKILKKRKD
jgi:hypothetical protein